MAAKVEPSDEVEQAYSGPIPSPETLREYERLLPGTADRIIAMAITEREHRHQLEKLSIEYEIRGRRLGLMAGVAVVCVGIITSGFLFFTGNQIPAYVITITYPFVFIASTLSGYLAARASERRSRSE